MRTMSVAGLLPVFAVLGGCVGLAMDRAGDELADVCEARGADMRIASPTAESRGGMFGTVVVTGDCVAPGEEGYDQAMPIAEYRARYGRGAD